MKIRRTPPLEETIRITSELSTPLLHGRLVNFFVVVTGETLGAHETFIRKLNVQNQKNSVDQSDFILAFCPSPSRAGTDVQEAMRKIPTGKPVILVVMHHRRDVAAYLDDSSRHVTREDVILTVDTLFWEGEFLKCSRNEEAFSKVLQTVGYRSRKCFYVVCCVSFLLCLLFLSLMIHYLT